MSFDFDYDESNLAGLMDDAPDGITNFKKPSISLIFHTIPNSSYDSCLKSSNAQRKPIHRYYPIYKNAVNN